MLIKCRECGKEISTQAAACPHCGCPVWQPTEGTPPKMEPEKKTGGGDRWIFAAIAVIVVLCILFGTSTGTGKTGGTSPKSYSTADYKSVCYSLAEDQVKKHLKAPSTASFCRMSEASFSKDEENTYVMTGWVDAENSFGAKLRSNWGIKVKVDGEKMTMVRLIIDGETVYP